MRGNMTERSMAYIEPCKPPVNYYDYSNPESQGALMAQTAKWPNAMSMRRRRAIHDFDDWDDSFDEPVYERVPVPDGLEITSAYVDRMMEWNYDKCQAAFKKLAGSGFRNSSDRELIAFCETYWPEWQIVAVRVVYYYNVSTGYNCQRIDVLYKNRPATGESEA